ncbi:long-chain acyl-CoA synthetase [Lentzea xinjiangensis]|uniref:Long-chain acyl-CoA synthetase n=1 Tax=Lentzea xinjiangensis TaxID=402600 RepID=A0A1H9NJX3_9PSEU|nr:AMP-binding protein [Lentzea xinjiangensis]SER36191.1 long-chain acyl-CoA synthetase [Lentzea xinjiangensis]
MSTATTPSAGTLTARLAAVAAERPDHVAVICGDDRRTYGVLSDRSLGIAAVLSRHGVTSGTRVGLLGRDSPLLVELLYACAHIGAVLVPVSARFTVPEVEHVLDDSTADLLVVQEESADLANRLTTAATVLPAGEFDSVDVGVELPPVAAEPDTPVVQLYTSGTTGSPKGVVLAHRSFFAVADALEAAGEDWVGFRPEDTTLPGVPCWHVGGVWWVTQTLNAGATLVLMPAISAADMLGLIRRHRVTYTCAPPALLSMLLDHAEGIQGAFSSLRKVVYGAAPIAESLLLRCLDEMGCEFAQIYGLTETGNTVACLPPSAHRPGSLVPGAAGRPYPGFAVKVVDAEGREVPGGATGELCVRTPARMIEYWRRPEATAKTLRDGWIHTGDVGHVDEHGYIHLSDRLNDTIIRAGENIYPAEIERALHESPAVADAAVIGIPDDRWGEAVLAFVVAADGHRPTSRELRRFLTDRLADFKIPTRFVLTDGVPRNSIGKVLRRELREPYWLGRERNVN